MSPRNDRTDILNIATKRASTPPSCRHRLTEEIHLMSSTQDGTYLSLTLSSNDRADPVSDSPIKRHLAASDGDVDGLRVCCTRRSSTPWMQGPNPPLSIPQPPTTTSVGSMLSSDLVLGLQS